MRVTYLARGSWMSAGGQLDVAVNGVEVASVSLTPGGLFGPGPSWTWHGAVGAEWTLSSSRGRYELVTVDRRTVGTMQKRLLARDLDLATVGGWTGVADHIGWGSRRTEIHAGDDLVATVMRRTGVADQLFSRREEWELDIDDALADDVQLLVSAVPLALDHQQRRAEQSSP